MSRIATKWLVLQEHPVTAEDLDADGAVRDETVQRWVTAARDAYLEHCTVLRSRAGHVLKHRAGPLPTGALGGRPEGVVVSASTSEFRPGSFTISVRVRPFGGASETPVNVACTVSQAHAETGEVRELGTEVRDELIALERSAQHYN